MVDTIRRGQKAERLADPSEPERLYEAAACPFPGHSSIPHMPNVNNLLARNRPLETRSASQGNNGDSASRFRSPSQMRAARKLYLM